MVKQTTERIKLHPHTKKLLDGLKTTENWTFDSVIQFLLCEYEEITDSDVIADKTKKLKEEYVDRSEYSRLYAENNSNRKRIKELDGQIEKTLGGMKEEKKGFIVKFKEQQESYEKLHVAYVEKQKILITKAEELKNSHKENEYLNQTLDQLNIKLSDTQKNNDESNRRHKNFKEYVDQEYLITKTQLDILYQVSVYLSHPLNKRRVFTVSQLYGKLPFYGSGGIEEIIPLLKYKIFPVRTYIENDVVCFVFDRHYLKY